MKRGSESVIERFGKVKTSAICIFIFLFAALYPLAFYNFDDIHAGDIAEYINNPLRVLSGDNPYTDFWLIFPPLEVYYPALLYAVFGVKMFVLFVSSWIFGALCSVMVFLISLRLMKSKLWSLLTAFLFFFSGMISHYSGFDYGGHIYLFFLLVAIYIFLSKPNDLSKKSILGIGLLIGIAAGFRIDLAGAYFLALLATFVYMRKKRSIDNGKLFQYIVNLCLGCLVIFGLVYLPFGADIPRVVEEILVKPPVHATNAQISIFDSIAIVAQGFGQSAAGNVMTLFRLVYDILYKIIPISTLILFIFFLREKPYTAKKIPIVLLMFWALFTLPKMIAVPDVHYLSVLNSTVFIAFIYLSKEMVFSENRKVKRYLKTIFVLAILILLVAVPASRAVDYISFASKDTVAVYGEADTLYLKDAAKAYEIQEIVNFVQKNVAPGEHLGENLLIVPFFAPPIYEMTGRTNPTYYDSFIDFGFVPSEEKQRELCRQIIRTNIKYVVYGNECQIYWNGECRSEGFEILDECINERFKETDRYGPYSIYQTK